MMINFMSLSTCLLLAGGSFALSMSELEGTWSSKSNAVFTGPDFYDPVDELLIEPALPGISYSFTADGYYEEALYRITPDPKNPACPTAVLTFQHGKVDMLDNGTLHLSPFQVDGRQVVSIPCKSDTATYERYYNAETMLKWAVYVDPYHGRYRLDLYQWDGAPLPPLYLAYKPPMMLPTITMNPTASAGTTSNTKRSLREKVRRSLANKDKTTATKVADSTASIVWWTGLLLMGFGATGWYLL